MKDPKKKANNQEFSPNHILFKQGSKGGELFFLKRGSVELTVRDKDGGAEAVVAVVSAPAVLGTMTFLEGEPRSASARSITDIEVLVVGPIQREKLLNKVPTWFKVLLKDLSSNLRNLNEEFVKIKAKNEILEKRLAIMKNREDAAEKEKKEKK